MIKHPSFSRDYHFSAVSNTPDAQAQARLRMLFEELQALFSGAAGVAKGLPIALMKADEPRIVIYNMSGNISARVTFDAENGLYVFSELDRADGIVLATASEERLIDEIVAHVSAGDDELTPHTVDTAVGILVGQTMEDVERKLILQTLRQCDGNPTYAAFMLGIPLITLCTKLATYFARSAKDFADATDRVEPMKEHRQ
ncbi:helix-turn-helix domain-containing protein [Rhizobium calliandrae]|uniref:Helix-turn-helix domain-containing protein n=1 Tax=Rhizobium calliandrae TaxID=1312182 RepID=A0ABT7KDR9_9HYPH|nr:helix-turn-helix domain-containing protein [Rhizobium calliandrae]MDL2406771.1 helix-turn-helix domain-containing protein [Rhizobium calliandrae]